MLEDSIHGCLVCCGAWWPEDSDDRFAVEEAYHAGHYNSGLNGCMSQMTLGRWTSMNVHSLYESFIRHMRGMFWVPENVMEMYQLLKDNDWHPARQGVDNENGVPVVCTNNHLLAIPDANLF